jgi:hypothetical protein
MLYKSLVEIPSNSIKFAKIWFIDIQVLEFLMVHNNKVPQSSINICFHIIFFTVKLDIQIYCYRQIILKNMKSKLTIWKINRKCKAVKIFFSGITYITRFLLHNFQLKLLYIALYYFMNTLYMYSNWNNQNLLGKICRIQNNPIMISPYSIFEVDKLPQDEIFQILNINHIFNIVCLTTAKTHSIAYSK